MVGVFCGFLTLKRLIERRVHFWLRGCESRLVSEGNAGLLLHVIYIPSVWASFAILSSWYPASFPATSVPSLHLILRLSSSLSLFLLLGRRLLILVVLSCFFVCVLLELWLRLKVENLDDLVSPLEMLAARNLFVQRQGLLLLCNVEHEPYLRSSIVINDSGIEFSHAERIQEL